MSAAQRSEAETLDILIGLEGEYVGQLSAEEDRAFEWACLNGFAYRSYEGPAGLMGLGKVRLSPNSERRS